jgi:predicted translin family RNA/ssDNA-binding protein
MDKQNLSALKSALQKHDETREKGYTLGRELTKKSKIAIYSIHRNDLKEAESLLKEIEKVIPKDKELLWHINLEEYAEAKLFFHFIKTGTLLNFSKLNITAEAYLGGLADLTGELERRSVLLGSGNKEKEVKQIRDMVDDIHGAFLQIDFRNGELRRKYDAIKWNLSKIERVLYDLQLKK